jgi:hypothetical protein
MSLKLSTGLRNKLLGINTELIINGGFASAVSSWIASSANLSSVASGQAGNCLQIDESGNTNPGQAYQDITTIIGRLYQLSLYFKQGTSSVGAVYVGTTGSPASLVSKTGLADAAWTQYTLWFIATATTTRITLESSDTTAGENSYFDTVSLVDFAKSFQDIFKYSFIDIYTGTQPATADLAPTGSLLLTISNNGGVTGLTFADAASGSILKTLAETWSGTVVLAGTGGWARLRATGDDNGVSAIEERVDGVIATSGGEFNFQTGISWALSSIQSLTNFRMTIPTL